MVTVPDVLSHHLVTEQKAERDSVLFLQISLVHLPLKFIHVQKRTWSMTLALKMASSMCFSSDLMTHLMLLTTCWTSGGRPQLECSRNLATNILVSLYIFRSASECGCSWGACVYGGRGLRWMSAFLPSFCCFETSARAGLAPTPSAETSLVSKREKDICQTLKLTDIILIMAKVKVVRVVRVICLVDSSNEYF